MEQLDIKDYSNYYALFHKSCYERIYFGLDLDRLANLTQNNTFSEIADYTPLYLSNNITDLNKISTKFDSTTVSGSG